MFTNKKREGIRHGSHLANLCQNVFTLRWKSVIAGLCLVRPQVFPFGKNFAKRQNIKAAVVLGWSRQIFAKSSQTMGIAEATVNACQRYMKKRVVQGVSLARFTNLKNRGSRFTN